MAPPPVRRTTRRERRIPISGAERDHRRRGEGRQRKHARAADWQTIREGSSTRRHHGRYTRKGRDSGPVGVIDRPASRRGRAALLCTRSVKP